MSQHHIYARHIDLQERTSLSVLASMVNAGSTLLDLGCGSGSLGAYLQSQRGCTLDGVTLSDEEASLARPHYRDVLIADLDTLAVDQAFHGKQYDYIICADVLEHLKQPERILSCCRDLLAPQGQVLISVPNANYSGLLMELMQGELRYRTEGLLDRTHLRFFTRKSLLRFLQEQSWSVQSLQTIERSLDNSEFKHLHADIFPPAVIRHLMAQPDALTYQFICAARPSELVSHANHALFDSVRADAQPDFATNVYWADSGQYREAQKLTAHGHIGEMHQRLSFALPAFGAAAPTLRWDPANRPGFLHLHGMCLKNPQGQIAWRWDSLRDWSQTPHNQLYWQPAPATAMGSSLLLLTDDDPWLQLPIPAEVLQSCMASSGSTLEMEIGWPMSADYAMLAGHMETLRADLQRADQETFRWRHEHTVTSQALHDQHQRAEQLQSICEERFELIQAQQQCIAHLQAHVAQIEASGAYRAVQKISRIKRKLLGSPTHSVAQAQPQTATPEPVAPAPEEPASAIAMKPTTTLQDSDALTNKPEESAHDQQAEVKPQNLHTRRPICVIVPVYRGLLDTQQCLNAALSAPTREPFRLVVINDASPEPELQQWLRELAARDPRVQLLENPENLGFVGTVNKGMAMHPNADVVLLNSDTEVSNDWLDRLQQAAYSRPGIASVTPLSNNATICSYPRFCSQNALPRDISSAQLDQLCVQANSGAAVEIPTGVGFCMYIRRDCLEQVGLFDEANFGKGYGEENDFCMRAISAGWQHLLSLDTFVLHTGGVSFGESKTPREQAAYEKLKQLHPAYETLVHEHLKANPAQTARNNIDKLRIARLSQPRILMIMHNVGGGTQRHVRELAEKFHGKALVFVLTPLPDHFVRLQWLDKNEGYSEEFHWPTQSQELLQVLRELRIQQLHFHHLLGLDPQIMHLPQQLGLPYDFTAHDYFTACPQITLTNASHNYCGEQGVRQCTQCLADRPAPTQETIEDWRLRHRLFLLQARNVLAPSLDCALRMQRYFPGIRICHVPHFDLPATENLPPVQSLPLPAHANLRVFVLGGVSAAKGGNVLEAVALHAARINAPLELHLIGYPHRPMPTQPRASLTIHGHYDDTDLPALLQRLKPDVVWFPALWPETYSYTLSACLEAGLPVIAPDIGAFTERLACRPWTWLRPWNTTPDEWVDFLTQVRQSHFVDFVPPAPAPAAPQRNAELDAWSYDSDYLIA